MSNLKKILDNLVSYDYPNYDKIQKLKSKDQYLQLN